MELLNEESYNIKTIDEDSMACVKKRIKPIEDESQEEYQELLQTEFLLEKAYRLRKIAEQLENRALKEQRQTIRLVYTQNGNLTIKDK